MISPNHRDKAGGRVKGRRRSSLNPLRPFFAKHQSTGTVVDTAMVTASMKSLIIESDAVPQWDDTPGQHVRIQINDPLSLHGIVRPSETLRTYTVWASWPNVQRFEIRAHLFEGEGIGRHWIHNAQAGERLIFWGPMGAKPLPEADFYLFAGDETAAAGVGQLARSLPSSVKITGVFESDGPEHDMDMQHFYSLIHLHRVGESPVDSQLIPSTLQRLELPKKGVAYIGGEAKTGQAIRRILVEEMGWSKQSVIARPFWTPGKHGLHH